MTAIEHELRRAQAVAYAVVLATDTAWLPRSIWED